MKLILTILLLTFSFGCKSQNNPEKVETDKTTELKPPFKNQGEQENYWAQELFKKEYKEQSYELYLNEIKEKDGTEFIYDNKSFSIYGIDEPLKLLFKKGILYPQLISGFTTENRKTEKELDSLSVSERYFYELSRGYNLTIMNLEELDFLSNSPKIKRFRFWLGRPKSVNPQVYIFELTNENADKNTNLKEFITNSKLTFLKEGWIII
ncbi:hypothetical protein [Winogradskyella bathintestinalis]|uniref:Lipoprotein n=1 Tax=Winogradskyella bathintestinalis TaxID=3035208 RepID=A0ABT7ZZ43_9FLAO|nr:hypothetical protein [Winogradskyella bathintestinalis]MDN3494266.1 hypothetical protein [Winogradskyella bathintestinalis]